MKKEAFLGFGKFAKQIILHFDVKEDDVYIFDSTYADKEKAFEFYDYANQYKDFNWTIAIGYRDLRLKVSILEDLIAKNASINTLVHHTSFVSSYAKVYPGSIIYPMCNIDSGTKILQGVVLNNSVIVSHDCTVGIGSYVSPGVVISGDVTIGSGTFIGVGSIISNGINIGNNVTIGAGTVVTRNIPNNACVIGNPMKVLDIQLKVR